jgi:hypothetical protein
MIRKLHAFTHAGMSDCKRALDDASGDYFQALCTLLTPEMFEEKDQAFRVRSMCGKAVRDPVTKAESELMARLREHFAALSVRPHHVYFSNEALPRMLFADPSLFDRLCSATGSSWLSQVWTSVGNDLHSEYRLAPAGLATAKVTLKGGCEVAVITMPATESKHEADFVVVRRSPRRFRPFSKSSTIRYFLVLQPIHAPDWNLVVVDEILLKRRELTVKRRLDRENVSTTPEGLATLIREIR